MRVLVVKLGALGDVLRTTSILPGLHARHPGLEVDWVTAPGALDLVRFHPGVARVHALAPGDAAGGEALGAELARTAWDRVLSFDDEPVPCRLAARCAGGRPGVLSGAFEGADGRLGYTRDTAPWFEMGLLSAHGKAEADKRKKENRESHPALYARMLGIERGEPELPLDGAVQARARAFFEERGLGRHGPVLGLNTGAGGRWESKRLPVDRTLALVRRLEEDLEGAVSFLVLGGRDEAARNAELVRRAAAPELVIDAGTDHSLLDFAGLVDRLDLLVTSDSLALHVAIARRVPVVVFFAPTSAAEIELYGRGEKVASTAPDACSYRPDADTSTLTVERLAAAVHRVLGARR